MQDKVYKLIDLWPYKIKNVENFYYRDHPTGLNPKSHMYRKYWMEEFLPKMIEGYWVNDEGHWVYMPSKLFFYTNYGKIRHKIGKNKNKLMFPDLRDNEWIVFNYILCCQGFSGFEGDTEYTANILIGRIERGEKLNRVELDSLTNNVLKPDGTYKKFIDPWEYLREHYLITNPPDKPLGLPLYENEMQDGILLSARFVGKSSMVLVGDFVHEFLTSGVKYMADIQDVNAALNFSICGVDGKQLGRSIANISAAYNKMPGRFRSNDNVPDFPGPFYKNYQGTWGIGNEVRHIVKDKSGKPIIEGSVVQMRAITPDSTTVGAGDRFSRMYWEEFGFLSFALEIYANNRDSLRLDEKVGIAFYLGCVCAGSKVYMSDGSIKNVEDINKSDGILGFNYKTGNVAQQSIKYLNPPQQKECLHVTLSTGREIKCSIDHPLFARQRYESGNLKKKAKWYESKDLKVGCAIAVVDEVDYWGDDTIFDPWLVGFLVGDGAYGTSVKYTTDDFEVYDYLKNNYSATCYFENDTVDGRITRKGYIPKIKNELELLGLFGQSSIHKRLPEIIASCDKETVCKFLGGYYDAYGCIYYSKEKDYATIKLTSISVEMLKQTHQLLNKLGIHGTIRDEGVNEGSYGAAHTKYSLYIKDKYSLINFANNIPLKIGRKKEILESILTAAEDKKDYTFRKYNGLRWERVKEIKNIGLQDVYNLTAYGTNTYIVNGIYTHNTGGDSQAIREPKMMYENPNEYDVFGIPDYFLNQSRKTGLFIPAYYQKSNFKDKNGNTYLEEAFEDQIKEREDKRAKSDSYVYAKHVMYNPLNPDDMLTESGESILPKQEAADRLSQMNAYGVFEKEAMVGRLSYNPSKPNGIAFEKDLTGSLKPILQWGLDREKVDVNGAFVMYEEPGSYIPDNLYWVIYDPAAKSGEGSSYHSVIVYKYFYKGTEESMEDNIVAEWIGRKTMLNDNYEEVVKIAKYYNAKIFPETNVAGFIEWASEKGYWTMLEGDAYKLELEISPSTKRSFYKKGFTMTGGQGRGGVSRKKWWCLQKLHNWLTTPTAFDKDGVPIRRKIDNMYSPMILDEVRNYNSRDNFDHISSMLGLMLLLGKLDMEPITLDIEDPEEIPNYEYKEPSASYKRARAGFLNY